MTNVKWQITLPQYGRPLFSGGAVCSSNRIEWRFSTTIPSSQHYLSAMKTIGNKRRAIISSIRRKWLRLVQSTLDYRPFWLSATPHSKIICPPSKPSNRISIIQYSHSIHRLHRLSATLDYSPTVVRCPWWWIIGVDRLFVDPIMVCNDIFNDRLMLELLLETFNSTAKNDD